jgi:hypothetical protein
VIRIKKSSVRSFRIEIADLPVTIASKNDGLSAVSRFRLVWLESSALTLLGTLDVVIAPQSCIVSHMLYTTAGTKPQRSARLTAPLTGYVPVHALPVAIRQLPPEPALLPSGDRRFSDCA